MALKDAMSGVGGLGHGTGSVITGGVFTIVSTPSIKVKAGGQGVHKGGVNFTFAGGNAPGCDPGTVFSASGTVSPGGSKVKAEGSQVMRVDDQSTTGNFQCTLSGNPVVVGDQPVKVASAGQSKVKAE